MNHFLVCVIPVLFLQLPDSADPTSGGYYIKLFRHPSFCPLTSFCWPWNPTSGNVQSWAKERDLGCVNSSPVAGPEVVRRRDSRNLRNTLSPSPIWPRPPSPRFNNWSFLPRPFRDCRPDARVAPHLELRAARLPLRLRAAAEGGQAQGQLRVLPRPTTEESGGRGGIGMGNGIG